MKKDELQAVVTDAVHFAALGLDEAAAVKRIMAAAENYAKFYAPCPCESRLAELLTAIDEDNGVMLASRSGRTWNIKRRKKREEIDAGE